MSPVQWGEESPQIAWESETEEEKRARLQGAPAAKAIAWEPEPAAREPGVLEKLGQSFSAAVPATMARFKGLEEMVMSVPAPVLGMLGTGENVQTLAAPARPETLAPIKADRQALEAEAKAKRPDVSQEGLVMQEVLNAPENLAVSLASLGVGLATKSPLLGLGSFGAPAVGGGYTKASDAGKDPLDAATFGLTEGAIEVGTEANPVFAAMKALKGTGLLKVAKEFFIKDFLGEQAATLLSDLNEWVRLNPEKTGEEFLKERPEAALRTAVSTIASGGAQTAGLTGVGKLAEVTGKRLDKVMAKKMQEQEEIAQAREAGLQALAEGEVDTGGVMGDNGADYTPQTPPDSVDDTNILPAGLNAVAVSQTAATGVSAPAESHELTPEQLVIALDQEQKFRTGKSLIPDNPEGVAALSNLNQALAVPTFKQATEEQIQERAAEIAEVNPGMAQDVSPLTGESKALRRAREEFPQALPADQREIGWSSNPDEVGLTSRQVGPQLPGTVRLIGGTEEQFSPVFQTALGETLSAWTQKFLPPDAKVVVNLSGMSGDAVGAYQTLADGTHVISPQEIVRVHPESVTNPNAEQDGVLVKFNQFSQVETYYGLTHEFGHAILQSQFVQGMPEEFKLVVKDLDNSNAYFTPEQLAQMPEEHAAVIDSFQQKKMRIGTGQMTAKEMLEEWSGTWKLGDAMLRERADLRTIHSIARRALAGLDKNDVQQRSRWADGALVETKALTDTTTALELIHALGRDTSLTEAESNAKAEAYYLSFNEYMAEQFSRYAYANKIEQGTALGRYFSRALQRLKEFFGAMKAEGFIKPDVSFQIWIDGLVRARALKQADGAKKAPKGRKAVAARKVASTESPLGKASANDTKWKIPKEAKGDSPFERVAKLAAQTKTSALAQLAKPQGWAAQMTQRVKDLGIPPTKAFADLRADIKAAIENGQAQELDDLINEWEQLQPKLDVKGKGGNWFHSSVVVMANPLYTSLLPPQPEGLDFNSPEWKAREAQSTPIWEWSRRIVTVYLNRYAGTKEDPLKNIMLPSGKTWGETMDLAISARPPETANGETLWDLPASPAALQLRDYMEHASDYLRAQVPQEKWFKYDLTRLLAEVARDDTKTRALAEKALLADLSGFPVHKAYADGSRWLAVPDTADAKVMAITRNLGEVGGWCTRHEEAALRSGSGERRLFTLVDVRGTAQAQIEVVTSGDSVSIAQLKGRFNGAVAPEWLPHARDFLDSGKWDSVKDLGNVGLMQPDVDSRIPDALRNKVLDQVAGVSPYVPEVEVFAILDPMLKELQPQKDGAGLVYDNPTPEVRLDINNSNKAVAALRKVGKSVKTANVVANSINFTANLKYNILQIQQLAATSTNQALQSFTLFLGQLGALKNNLLKSGSQLAETWEHMNGETVAKFEKVLLAEELTGEHATNLRRVNGIWTHVAGAELDAFLVKQGVNPTTTEGLQIKQMLLDYKNSILQHIEVRESSTLKMLQERYRKAPLVVKMRSNEISNAAQLWRSTPYIPRGRFGNFIIKIHGENPLTGRREIVHVEHFETAAAQDAAHKEFLKKYPAKDVKATQISEKAGIQMTLPREFLQTLTDMDEFSPDQIREIGEAMTPIRTDKVFRTFARDASKVSGFSSDMLKNYTSWIEDSANATAKYVYGRRLTQAVAWARQTHRDLLNEEMIPEAREAQRIVDAMDRAKDYILHPLAEYHQIKNFVSLAYLVWMPATAIMNAMGMLQTWAATTAEFGDLKGNAMIGKVTKDITTGALTEDDIKVLGRAEEDGVTEQGYAYMMAGLTNANALTRRIRTNVAGKAQRAFLEGGMKPFQLVEGLNRKTSLLVLHRLILERNLARVEELGISDYETLKNRKLQAHEEAYQEAVKKTKLLQNDYAAGNRPAWMQGKASLLMIFYSYMQYMSWLMTGGYGRMLKLEVAGRNALEESDALIQGRTALKPEKPISPMGGFTLRMWVMFAFLFGYEGVWGGKFIMNLLQLLWDKFGDGTNLTAAVDKMLQDVGQIDSLYWRRFIRKGLLYDVGGVNLSDRGGLGNFAPGMKMLESHPRTKNDLVGSLVLELSGPFGGVSGDAVELAMADELGAKELGQGMPGVAGTVARAYDAWKTGLTGKKGELLLREDYVGSDGRVYRRARKLTPGENALMLAGFSLTEVADKQHFEKALKQQVNYWSGRRLLMFKNMEKAVRENDLREITNIEKDMAAYSDVCPPELVIRNKEINAFIKAKATEREKLEADIVTKSQESLAEPLRIQYGRDN